MKIIEYHYLEVKLAGEQKLPVTYISICLHIFNCGVANYKKNFTSYTPVVNLVVVVVVWWWWWCSSVVTRGVSTVPSLLY